MSDRTPESRKPEGITDAFAITPFVTQQSSKAFRIPPTIQTDFERY